MKIVVLDGYTLNPGDNPWTAIAALGELAVYDRTPEEAILSRAYNADIVLTNKTLLSAATIATLPRLKYIGVLATGYDIVDTAAARARGIPVTNVPVYGTDAVAEHVFALLLNFWRQPQRHSDLVKEGAWTAAGDFCFWRTPLIELSGRTLGLVGFGRIGRRVGELAAAFKMQVLVAAPRLGTPPTYRHEVCGLPELCARADAISLHCRLTPDTRGLVSRSFLGLMKNEAFLINTSRGGLVDEVALADALNTGQIAGAALDVGSKEPITPDNPLLRAKNVTLTPHIAWAALAARQRLMHSAAENVAAFVAGRPIHVVN